MSYHNRSNVHAGRVAQVALALVIAFTGTLTVGLTKPQRAVADSDTYSWSNATYVDANYDWGYSTCPSNDSGCMAMFGYNAGVKYGEADPWIYNLRNCTSYVAQKISQEFNGRSVAGWKNAYQWGGYAQSAGYSLDGSPQVGDIAVWGSEVGGGYGHVAYVYAVNSGVGSLDEYNVAGTGLFSSNRTTASGSAGPADSYIHIGTPNDNTPPPSSSNIIDLPGKWDSSSIGQDVLYITPRSDGGSDFAVETTTSTGVHWAGSWASASNIAYATTQFIPDDFNSDGLMDLLYVTPNAGGGFAMGYFRNTGSNFTYAGTVWAPTNLGMSQIKFLPGHWTSPTSGDLAYVTPDSNGNLDVAVLRPNGTTFDWMDHWWQPNLPYSTTKYLPADTDGDGYTDLLYMTPNAGGGFAMALDHNTYATGGHFSWWGQQWLRTDFDMNTTHFIPGYFGSTTHEGFAYTTPDGTGFDMGVMNYDSSGMHWVGTWWPASNLAYNAIDFIPADYNGDGTTDLFYVTPQSGGGFSMALNQNAGNSFSYVGQQWDPTNLSMSYTTFVPQF